MKRPLPSWQQTTASLLAITLSLITWQAQALDLTDKQIKDALKRGHAESKHVDQNQNKLLKRLKDEGDISAATSFASTSDLEKAIESILNGNSQFEAWLENCSARQEYTKSSGVNGSGMTRGEYNNYENAKKEARDEAEELRKEKRKLSNLEDNLKEAKKTLSNTRKNVKKKRNWSDSEKEEKIQEKQDIVDEIEKDIEKAEKAVKKAEKKSEKAAEDASDIKDKAFKRKMTKARVVVDPGTSGDCANTFEIVTAYPSL